jgi:hypothetical protein
MANLIGPQSKRLEKISNISIWAMAVYGTLLICLLVIVVVQPGYNFYNPLYLLLLIPIAGPAVAWLLVMFKKMERDSYTYAKGDRGEKSVLTELTTSLSDDYVIFHHVVLEKNKGDIDFIVLGPTGLFILEVKNYSGEISLINDILMRDAKPFEKDILWQAKGQARILEQYLKKTLGITIFSRKVVVFCDGATMKFGLTPVHDIYIIKNQWLKKLIEEISPTYVFPVDRKVIQEQIYKAVLDYYK